MNIMYISLITLLNFLYTQYVRESMKDCYCWGLDVTVSLLALPGLSHVLVPGGAGGVWTQAVPFLPSPPQAPRDKTL